MLPRLVKAANQVSDQWPAGRDFRVMAREIAERAGVAFEWIIAPSKGCALVDRFAIKSGNGFAIEQALELVALIGPHFAKVYAHGPNWMIQERVISHDGARLSRMLEPLGVHDIRRNCGIRDDGQLVAFDGFHRFDTHGMIGPWQHPPAQSSFARMA